MGKQKQKQGQMQKQKRISPAEIIFAPFIAVENVVEKIASRVVLWIIA